MFYCCSPAQWLDGSATNKWFMWTGAKMLGNTVMFLCSSVERSLRVARSLIYTAHLHHMYDLEDTCSKCSLGM